MEAFYPFRVAGTRKQKCNAQNRMNYMMNGPIFNLPRQIITNGSKSVINPEITHKIDNNK